MKYSSLKYDELQGCAFVKTGLMMLVLIYHSLLFWGGEWFGKPIDSAPEFDFLSQWLNTFHIFGFSFVSGYLFYFLKIENGKYPHFGSFIAGKAKRLLIPYFFVLTVWVIPFQQLFLPINAKKLFEKYILATAPSQLWFLLMLFTVFVVFFPLSNFLKKHTVLGLLIFLLAYFSEKVLSPYIPNLFCIFRTLNHLIVFWLGFKYRQFKDTKIVNFIRKIPAPLFLLSHLGLFTLRFFLVAYNDIAIIQLLNYGLLLLLRAGGAIMIFNVLQKVSAKVPAECPLFKCVSKCGMPIYLFHQQLIYVFLYFLNGVIHPHLLAPIIAVCVFLISTVLSLILLKFKTTSFLIGEKYITRKKSE